MFEAAARTEATTETAETTTGAVTSEAVEATTVVTTEAVFATSKITTEQTTEEVIATSKVTAAKPKLTTGESNIIKMFSHGILFCMCSLNFLSRALHWVIS